MQLFLTPRRDRWIGPLEPPEKWIKRQRWPRKLAGTTGVLSVVDLFAGCGGMTLGAFEAARIGRREPRVAMAIELAEPPIQVYRSNFDCSEDVARREDVASVFSGALGRTNTARERDCVADVGKPDVLLAGPPCQGHSDLNNSTRRSDPRNAYYLTTVRAIEVLRPTAAIIENVPAAIHDRGQAIQKSRKHLESIGYTVDECLVRFCEFGLPQLRKRHILVAFDGESPGWDKIPLTNGHSVPSIGTFLSGLEDEPEELEGVFYRSGAMTGDNNRRVKWLFENDEYDLPNRLRPRCHRDNNHSYISMYGRLKWDRPAQTITTGFGSMGQGRFVHPTRQRTITPHEAARIQGFPDFFDFSRVNTITALREMIGNAVPPQLTQHLVSELLDTKVL